MYKPDRWVVIKVTDTETNEFLYRVFASWYGGYAGADSWQMNSGIVKVTENGNYLEFHGNSGSIYQCHLNGYGTSMYGQSILNNFTKNAKSVIVETLDENTDFLNMDYSK